MKTVALIAVIACACALCLCQTNQVKPGDQKQMSAPVVNGSNNFATDLYAKLAADAKGNLFFSPGSIDTALAMTYCGASGNTADQMAKTMHFTLPADKLSSAYADLIKTLNNPPQVETVDESGKPVKGPAYQLVVANALWGQKGYAFKPDFTKLLDKSYGAGLNDVDFSQSKQAAKTINDWVALQTKDKIKDLVPQSAINSLTRLVLTNAVYFKSNWADKFQKVATKDAPFRIPFDRNITQERSLTIQVPTMHQRHHFGYVENDKLQMLELPYAQNELSMIVLLPKLEDMLAKEVGRDDLKELKALEAKLTADNIDKWLKDKKSELVDVSMPKFTFSSQFMLADTLKAMGMTDAFDAAKADFSGMTDKEKLCISNVIHKAFVAVDEEGTEAAAATAVIMLGSAMRAETPKTFNADHPFVFIIRHNSTGEILFMGRLANPKAE
jgi:serpin B